MKRYSLADEAGGARMQGLGGGSTAAMGCHVYNGENLYSMKTVHKSVLIWYSPEEMFDLVTKVEDYPQFLPWCDYGRVLECLPDGMVAEVGIAMAGIKQSFQTRNVHVPGREVIMNLVRGPFSHLKGVWRFDPVGDGSQRACRVTFEIEYDFSSRTLSAVVGPIFGKITSTFVDAFIQRAKQVYG